MITVTSVDSARPQQQTLALKARDMWQSLKSDFSEFVRAAGEEGGVAIATLDKKLNELDDQFNEVTGGNRNEDDDNIDLTGGDANDVFVGQIGSIENVSPPDLTEISDAAMNVGKSAASLLSSVGEKVGGAATSLRMHHQSTGRPPFVISAVEDDDDEYIEEEEQYNGQCEEEESEEEELGWTESEEEEESGDDEVDFTNEGTSSHLPLESLDVVKMRENLKNAEEERNQCMQMVEDRNQEICRLNLALDQCTIHESAFNPEGQCLDDLRREVFWFRKLIAVTRQEESPTELKSILSEMRDKISNTQNNVLEMKIQSAKDCLATCYAKIDHSLIAREDVMQTALKEQIGEIERKDCALRNEIRCNSDQIAQLKVLQRELEEQSTKEAVQLARPCGSPSSSTSSGVLI